MTAGTPRPGAGAFSVSGRVAGQARRLLEAAYRAAIASADPAAAARTAVAAMGAPASATRLFALGKGAPAMAAGARAALEARGGRIAGGLVVTHAAGPDPGHGLPTVIGDHPVPGARSADAAARLASALAEARPDEDALVLLSGGATSLVAAPVDGVPVPALRETFELLLASGTDIVTMNALRKRLLRWGAGRLALALASRRIDCLVASDVLDAGVESVASGPCSPDPMTAAELRETLRSLRLAEAVPSSVRDYLAAVAAGRREETPKPSAARFQSTVVRVILDYRAALRGAADALRTSGAAPVELAAHPLRGEAAIEGGRFATRLAEWRPAHSTGPAGGWAALVVAAETTVTGATSGGGGRCQEFALSCARELDRLGARAGGCCVLAAGTDGRDGPTDAAGAVVDARTWSRIQSAGGSPAEALAAHRSHDALDRAGALLRTGPTGTNVNDLIIGLVAPEAHGSR